MKNNMMTVEEAAEYLRISKSYFYILMKRKNIKPHIQIGRRHFFTADQLNDFADNEMPESSKVKNIVPIASMELRDQFAMAALTGLLVKVTAEDDKDAYASCAYDYADAMIKAREVE